MDGMTGENGLFTGEWRYLAMLNFRVDPGLLRPYVPHGTELDLWRGECWMSVVGLRFAKLGVMGLPVPLHQDFGQVNLRFYVRRGMDVPGGAREVRRGAVFLVQLAPRPFLAAAARLVTNEPFRAASLRYKVDLPPTSSDPSLVEYAWDDPGSGGRVVLAPSGPGALLAPDSFEEYVAERCWGYTPQPDGSTLEYRVRHTRWRVWPAEGVTLDGDLEAAFGSEWANVLRAGPDRSFLAEGSPIGVEAPVPIAGAG